MLSMYVLTKCGSRKGKRCRKTMVFLRNVSKEERIYSMILKAKKGKVTKSRQRKKEKKKEGTNEEERNENQDSNVNSMVEMSVRSSWTSLSS